MVGLRELFLGSPERTVTELTDTTVSRVRATDPAKDAARPMRETNLLDLPVVDSENRLVGLLTVDDAVEVIEAADTEDAAPWPGHSDLCPDTGRTRLSYERAEYLFKQATKSLDPAGNGYTLRQLRPRD